MPNQRRQARIMPPPPTPEVRNQFIAPVGGGYSHIHPDNGPPSRANGGFGSTRSPVTACRRRVAPLMLQFPLATMSGLLK